MLTRRPEFTQATPTDASRLLKQFRYDLSRASDAYWEDEVAMANTARAASQAGPAVSRPKLEALFNSYAEVDGDKDKIDMDGTMRYAGDLGVELDDIVMLAIAELCAAPEMGVFARKGFVDGWAKARFVCHCRWTSLTARAGKTRSSRSAPICRRCGPA